jgi:hypothetical protein
MKLNKDNVIRMLAKAGITPALREKYQGFDIFIGDGFTDAPDLVLKRFGVEPGAFPHGAYMAAWFVAKGERHFEIGAIIPFDRFHDRHLDPYSKAQARVNRAKAAAMEFVNKRLNVVKETGNRLHA